MVDRFDEGIISPDLGVLDYKGLYKAVGKALFRAHVEGQLKSEILSKPELFVEPDPELPLALLDQKEAGKKLLLITNSDYIYTDKMMRHSFNRFLPNDMNWRDLFEMGIGPRVLWIGIGGSIFFGVLEKTKKILEERRPTCHNFDSDKSK